jgi:hypothetical protein
LNGLFRLAVPAADLQQNFSYWLQLEPARRRGFPIGPFRRAARPFAPAASAKFDRSSLPAFCSTGSAPQATQSVKQVLIIYVICHFVNDD